MCRGLKICSLLVYISVNSGGGYLAERPMVSSLIWKAGLELDQAQGDVLKQLGFRHQFFFDTDNIPDETNYVFLSGPCGSFIPFVKKIRSLRQEKRPVIIYWFTENLMLDFPPKVLGLFQKIFSDLNFLDFPQIYQSSRKLFLRIFRGRGSRFASLGDIIWLRKNGLLDVLGLSASYYVNYFQKVGINAVLIPRGYHPSYGRIMNLERDIPVTWMGKIRNRRRAAIIYGLRDKLRAYGLKMHIHDNASMPFIFGEERTNILNRSLFVLNVLAYPTDEVSIRYYIAAANGAVILTEPGMNEYPFENGRHLIECSIDDMAEKVVYYQRHLDEWQQISLNMLGYMKHEVTLEKSVMNLMGLAEQVAASR